MANPSLQIGNSNWAIKEDNLLGYSTAGTRFVPQPITMTRESAGTRVNSEGLVETVELLGSEDVVNGSFTTDSDWNTSATGISIAGGKLLRDATATLSIVQLSSVITPSVTYKITFEIVDYTSGTLTPRFGWNGTGGTAVSGVGTYTQIITKVNQNVIELYGTAFIGSITNVSVKEYTANNLARVDYDGTASSLLVEPERTNLITYSNNFTDSSWTKLGAGTGSTSVVTSNYAISPDGTQNATRLVCDLNGGTTTSDQSLIYDLDSSNTSQSISIYIKSNTGSNQNIYFANTFGTGDTAIVTSEWQRFEFNHSTSNHTFSLGLRGNTGADNTADVLIWAAQSENGSYATSYIPTDGGTVTRVQDQYSKTGISNLINSEEGVLFLEMAALSDDGTYRLMNIRDVSNTDNFIYLGYKDASNTIRTRIEVGGVASTDMEFVLSNETEFNKIAIKWKTNDFALWVNGVEVATDSSGVSFTANTLDELSLDRNGSLEFNGKVKQLQIFKTALTDPELVTLTTI